MGTNFYLMSKSKKLIRENFAVEKNYGVTDVEYELVDEPYLGYQIHLNKLSCGWRPLFQRHKNIKSFKQLEGFCMKNNNIVEIYDEYGEKYTWKQYYDKVYNHSQCKPKPFKWVYEIDLLFKDNKPTLHVRKAKQRYICLSVIKNIEKRKGAHGSVFMRMKDHGMV